MLKKLLLLMIVISTSANANQISIGGGALLNFGDFDDESGFDSVSKFSIQAGVQLRRELSDNIDLRTGILYTRKSVEVDVDNSSTDFVLSYDYLTIPATVALDLGGDDLSIIGGINLGIKISDDCEADSGSCTAKNVESFVAPLTFGFSKKIKENLFGEILYEHALGETAKDLKVSSLVANIFFII